VALTAPESSSLTAFCNCTRHAKYMVKNCTRHAKYMVKNSVRFENENDKM